MLGYWVEEKHGIEVAVGDDPMVISVPAYPAGAVYGQVLDIAGTPTSLYSATIITVERPPASRHMRFHVDANVDPDEDGRFMITPVPLGGTYRVTVSGHGHMTDARVMGRILSVNETHPIHEVNL